MKIKLIDAYPEWLTDGIFHKMDSYNVPWKSMTHEVRGTLLDMEYYGNRSGTKEVSPLIEKLIDSNQWNDSMKEKIVELILSKYRKPWTRAWEAMMAEYNPIHNYLMNKTETENRTLGMENTRKLHRESQEDGSSGIISSNTTSDSGTSNDTTTGNNNYSSNTNNGIYGFDSVSSANSNKSDTTQNNSSSTRLDSTDSRNITGNGEEERTYDNNTTEETTTSDNGQHTTAGTITTNTSGNIGVTTSQEMIESELKLRFDWHYFDMVYKDVDHILTTGIFVEDEEYILF